MKRKRPVCSAVFEDGTQCRAPGATGSPPLCDDCAEAIQAEDAIEMIEHFGDRAGMLLDKLSRLATRATNLFGRVREGVRSGPPPPHRPAPPPPRQAPPPPAPPKPEEISLRRALYEFGWAPGKTFTAADVKKRHRELAVLFHSDKGGSDTRMAVVNRARDVLLKHCKGEP